MRSPAWKTVSLGTSVGVLSAASLRTRLVFNHHGFPGVSRQRLLLNEMEATRGEVRTMQRGNCYGDGLHAAMLAIVHTMGRLRHRCRPFVQHRPYALGERVRTKFIGHALQGVGAQGLPKGFIAV